MRCASQQRARSLPHSSALPGSQKARPLHDLISAGDGCCVQRTGVALPETQPQQLAKMVLLFFPPSDLHLTFTVNVESKPLFWSEPGIKQLPALILAHRLVVKHY